MRWTPTMIFSLLLALGLIGLGMWMIYSGTDGMAVAAAANAPGSETAIDAPPKPTMNPAALGFALMAGGVLLGFMTFRRV